MRKGIFYFFSRIHSKHRIVPSYVVAIQETAFVIIYIEGSGYIS